MQYLRRRVRRRTGDQPVRGLEPAADPSDAEIRQLRVAVLGEQDVRRFDVAMQGAAPVRGLQRAGHLHPDMQHIPPVDRTGVLDLGFQRAVRVVLHHDVGPPGGSGADLEDVDDVRMPGQLSHRHLLTHEPLHIVRLQIGRQNLHRDRAVQRALNAAIHHAEPAPPDLVGILETGRQHFRRDPGGHTALRRQRVAVGHVRLETPSAPWRHHLRPN